MTLSPDEAVSLLEQYLNAGFSLLPLNGKTPFERGWPHKPGLSIDEAKRQLEAERNIGLRSGAPSDGIFAIDVDRDWDRFAELNHEGLQKVRWIKTSEGRGRVLVKGQGWEDLKKTQPWGEILGDGQQCVLPPSIHPDTKKPYIWEGDPSLPFILSAEPEDFKFLEPLRKRSKPGQLYESEWETLKQLVVILGKEHNHLIRQGSLFLMPSTPARPDSQL